MIVGGALLVILLTSGAFVYLLGRAALDEYENQWKGSDSFHDPVLFSQTQQLGDSIIEALHQYRAVHDRYPGQLDRLVPDFLDEIPQPTAGYGEWDYRGNSDGFHLGFGVGRDCYPCSFRSDRTDVWDVDA